VSLECEEEGEWSQDARGHDSLENWTQTRRLMVPATAAVLAGCAAEVCYDERWRHARSADPPVPPGSFIAPVD
jgi:hypothetical protein